MYDKLPPDLVTKIYEYDATYHTHYKTQVMSQLLRVYATSGKIMELLLLVHASDNKFRREVKKVVRFSKKADLLSVYIWFGGRRPKHVTKTKLVLRIYISMIDLAFQEEQES
jgi:translation initiation factor IF-3